ncbi:MAG: DoxX family protein [Deltaproteobacteria bacterium]|nr:DoxX family protein [Deltaproteobacteria bacterium]MBW2664692.1 DoxX family protein [Deltaproteobacteria bacterium]
MTAFLKPHSEHIYALLRIVAGFMLMCHGIQKVFGLFGGSQAPPAITWSAGPIELVGGALVMVGFQAGWAAFLCSGMMAVAYFFAHQSKGLLPIANHGELAALYSFVFLFIAVRGSGEWSVDAARS